MSNTPALPINAAYDYLNRALQLLEKPRYGHQHSWITGAEAISQDGTYCDPASERADAWCTIGVLKAVTKYDADPDAAYRYCYSILNAANAPLLSAASGYNGKAGSAPSLNDAADSFDVVRQLFINGMNFLIRKGA